jgi:hypothetical protein
LQTSQLAEYKTECETLRLRLSESVKEIATKNAELSKKAASFNMNTINGSSTDNTTSCHYIIAVDNDDEVDTLADDCSTTAFIKETGNGTRDALASELAQARQQVRIGHSHITS